MLVKYKVIQGEDAVQAIHENPGRLASADLKSKKMKDEIGIAYTSDRKIG